MSSRKRARNHIQEITGGGGGAGTITGRVDWGPNFGETGDTHDVQVAHDLEQIETIFQDMHTTALNHSLNEIELSFDALNGTFLAHNITEFERTYDQGSNAVTQTAVDGRSDWQNISNAQGQDNGTNATITGNALEARRGRLNLDYQDFPDYTTFGFTVQSAHLDFYTTQSNTTLGNGNLQHQYDVGGSIITLDTFTGNKSGVSTYDITSAITSQATLDNLTAYVRVSYNIANLSESTCDAVILRLVVTHA